MPYDAAWASHPGAAVCAGRAPDRHGVPRIECGYPLDLALGELRVHPWCERYPNTPGEVPTHVRQRGRELAVVKATERRRMMGQGR